MSFSPKGLTSDKRMVQFEDGAGNFMFSAVSEVFAIAQQGNKADPAFDPRPTQMQAQAAIEKLNLQQR